MTFELSVPATVAVIALVLLLLAMARDWYFTGIISMLVLVASTITYCDGRPEKVAERAAEAEAARLAAIPHVIREADGCKVYAFAAGPGVHYFTRCAESVTTERFYTEDVKCGKNCVRHEPRSEVIVSSKGP